MLNSNRRPTQASAAAVSSPRQRKLILVVVALSLMMVVSAVSGLNVALADLARDTGATQREVQWIVDAYTMVFAGLLLVAGAIGDRFGRRQVLLAGLGIFGGAAALALFVDDPTALIAIRAAMGVGAAFVMPTTLSIITTSFPPAERARAVGVWVGIAGGGAVLGLLASGVLLEFFDWSSFFGLNVALAGIALAGAIRFVPASRDERPPRLDPVGAVLSFVGVTALVFGIIEGPERGWGDAIVLAGLLGGASALAAFVAWELRREDPLLDPRLFGLKGFGTGSLSITAQFFAAFGFFFIALQYLQFVAGLSPLESALAMLPMPFVLIPVARNAPRLARRAGINRVGALGLLLIAAGLALMSRVEVDFHYLAFAGGLVVFAAGMGLAGTPATTAIVSSLPESKQGVASAVNDVSREFGSAMGIAILGSVLNSTYRADVAGAVEGLPPEIAVRAEESIGFVQQAPLQELGAAGARLEAVAQQAFVNATSSALLVAAGVVLVAALYVGIRGPRRAESATLGDASEAHEGPSASAAASAAPIAAASPPSVPA